MLKGLRNDSYTEPNKPINIANIIEAGGTLDETGRQAVIEWLTDPFWP